MSFRPTNSQALRICSLAQDTGSTLAETLEALVSQALSEARVAPWDLRLDAGLQSKVEQVSGTVGTSPGELVCQFLDQRKADFASWLTLKKDKAVRQRGTTNL